MDLETEIGGLSEKLAAVTEQVRTFAAEIDDKMKQGFSANEILVGEYKEKVDKTLSSKAPCAPRSTS
jgi:hypothetical protein